MANRHDSASAQHNTNSFDITLYDLADGDPVEVHVDTRTGDLWATQAQIAALFEVTIPNVSMHLATMTETGEIDPGASIKESLIHDRNGRERRVRLYSHEAIVSIGFRTNSPAAVEFRKWARNVIASYQRDGYVLDHDRLAGDVEKAKRLTSEIAAIRASGRGMAATLGDVFKAILRDYKSGDQTISQMFGAVNDMLTYAVTGKTAAEVKLTRCDGSRSDMGLRSMSGMKPSRADIETARNYLELDELEDMNRIILGWTVAVEGSVSKGRVRDGAHLVDMMREIVHSHGCEVFAGYSGYHDRKAKAHVDAEFERWKTRNLPNAKPKTSKKRR